MGRTTGPMSELRVSIKAKVLTHADNIVVEFGVSARVPRQQCSRTSHIVTAQTYLATLKKEKVARNFLW